VYNTVLGPVPRNTRRNEMVPPPTASCPVPTVYTYRYLSWFNGKRVDRLSWPPLLPTSSRPWTACSDQCRTQSPLSSTDACQACYVLLYALHPACFPQPVLIWCSRGGPFRSNAVCYTWVAACTALAHGPPLQSTYPIAAVAAAGPAIAHHSLPPPPPPPTAAATCCCWRPRPATAVATAAAAATLAGPTQLLLTSSCCRQT
jgi:hypothetical protein